MNDLEIFKTLCDLWASHFSIMLTCITILAGLFGIGCPLMLSFFQRQNIKDERERLSKEMTERFAELRTQRDKISQQEQKIEELSQLLGNAYVALAQFFIDSVVRYAQDLHDPGKIDARQTSMERILEYTGKAIRCLINSRNKKELAGVMGAFPNYFSNITEKDKDLLKKALNSMQERFPVRDFFVRKEELSEIIGEDNEIYKEFVSKFKFLFDLMDTSE